MAKIIQFSGMYISEDTYHEIYLNADHITSLDKRPDKKDQPVTCISVIGQNSIYTRLSIEEVIALIDN